MSSISLEALDETLRGRYTQWILPTSDICSLPRGFQDQILSGSPQITTHILLMAKTDSRAWHLSFPWDMTFCPETNTDWSLLLSVFQHLKKPLLIVTTPTIRTPDAFWAKCLSMPQPTPTCVALLSPSTSGPGASIIHPHAIFFPCLQDITEDEFLKAPQSVGSYARQSIQTVDLRTLYRELRGAGASLCLSQGDPRHVPGSAIHYSAMWFYPETNGTLRFHLSDLRIILKTITDRLTEQHSG